MSTNHSDTPKERTKEEKLVLQCRAILAHWDNLGVAELGNAFERFRKFLNDNYEVEKTGRESPRRDVKRRRGSIYS